MNLKIAIRGKGGQGAKTLAGVIMQAALLENENLYVAMGQEYDAAVRRGISNSYLILSENPIINPVIDRDGFDIVIDIPTSAGQNKGIFLTGVITGSEKWQMKKELLEQALRKNLADAHLNKALKAFNDGVTTGEKTKEEET